MNITSLNNETKFSILREHNRSMPPKSKSKSIDFMNHKFNRYESMAVVVREYIRLILKHAWSEQLINDYEFIMTCLTLFHIRMIPKEFKHIRTLYNKYIKSHLFHYHSLY